MKITIATTPDLQIYQDFYVQSYDDYSGFIEYLKTEDALSFLDLLFVVETESDHYVFPMRQENKRLSLRVTGKFSAVAQHSLDPEFKSIVSARTAIEEQRKIAADDAKLQERIRQQEAKAFEEELKRLEDLEQRQLNGEDISEELLK